MYFTLCFSVAIVKCNSVNAGWPGLLLNIWNLTIKKLILQITWTSWLHTVIIDRRDAFDIYWSKNTEKELVCLLLSTVKKNRVIRHQFFVYSPKWSMCTLIFELVFIKRFTQKILFRVIHKELLAKILIKVSFMKVVFWKLCLMIGMSICRIAFHPAFFLSNVVRKTAMQTGLNEVLRPL